MVKRFDRLYRLIMAARHSAIKSLKEPPHTLLFFSLILALAVFCVVCYLYKWLFFLILLSGTDVLKYQIIIDSHWIY